MTDRSPSPKPHHVLNDWLERRFGHRGPWIAAALSLSLFVFWQWDALKERPGIRQVVEWVSRDSIPRADPARFSVAIARLDNDPKREYERLLVRLVREFDGVQVLSIDRQIYADSAVPEEAEREGHAKARQLLAQSGASVLLWGSVLRLDGNARPELYFTSSRSQPVRARQYELEVGKDFRLPSVFWSDLSDVMRLLLSGFDDYLRNTDGQYVADKLAGHIARVRTLLHGADARPGWNPVAGDATRMILASALRIEGEQSGKRQSLEEAVAIYQELLRPRAAPALNRAAVQNDLAVALTTLGDRDGDSAKLKTAIDLFRDALLARTKHAAPLEWAATQSNLGNALRLLGARESSDARLQESVAAYRAALTVRTQAASPQAWAKTQNSLGDSLRALGARSTNVKFLSDAVACYEAALSMRKRSEVPLDWARSQNNLGVALEALGDRQTGVATLKRAEQAYRAALLEWTRSKVPLDWARAQNNLGHVLFMIAERTSSPADMKASEQALRDALLVRTAQAMPLDWARTINNLGNVLVLEGHLNRDSARVKQGIAAYEAALTARKHQLVPIEWARTQNNLANATVLLADLGVKSAQVADAIRRYGDALMVYRKAGTQNYLATTQGNLAVARARLGKAASAGLKLAFQ